MSARVIWTELLSSDPERSRTFLAEVLGWSFEEFGLPGGRYWVARSGGETVAGLGELSTGSIRTERSYWMSFVEVEDVDRTAETAVAAGGAVVREPHDVPEVGRVGLIREPTGTIIGIMTAPSA